MNLLLQSSYIILVLTRNRPHISNTLIEHTRVCSLSLLQGIFPTQELNWGLLHCRQILYHSNWARSGHEIAKTIFVIFLSFLRDEVTWLGLFSLSSVGKCQQQESPLYFIYCLKNIYLAAPGLSHSVCGVFSYGVQAVICSIWDLVPSPGMEPRPPALVAWSLSH